MGPPMGPRSRSQLSPVSVGDSRKPDDAIPLAGNGAAQSRPDQANRCSGNSSGSSRHHLCNCWNGVAWFLGPAYFNR